MRRTIFGAASKQLQFKKGFSLMELLIVIAILGIIAAIALPRFNGGAAQRDLDISARQLAGDLRWSMQMAANSTDASIVQIVFVNASPFGYMVVQGAANVVIKPTYSFPTTVSFPNVQNAVSFDVNGRPVGGNDVIVTLRNTLGQNRVVTLDHLTGRVQVQ